MVTTSTQSVSSCVIIRNPSVSIAPYYCTEDEWRSYSGFTDQTDFPSSEVQEHLRHATEQIKKDGFYMVRWELVSKDSYGRMFTARRYWGNKYGTGIDDTSIIHGVISKYDIEVYEADVFSSVTASLALEGSRINRLMYPIPYDGITDFDPMNCWFILDPKYPTVAGRQIYVTYWVCGKPIGEITYELKRACMEYTTILALRKLKTKRLKMGTVSFSLGKQTITRDERIFDDMLEQHMKEYHKWVQWFRPFIGRRLRTGRMETDVPGRYINRY